MSEFLHTRRAFLPRYVTLLAGEAISKLCVFAAFVYLARVLGPQGFGQIEFALSLTVFFSLGVESGLGTYAARRVSLDPAGVGALLARVMLLRATLAVAGYLALLLIAQRVSSDLGAVVRVYGLLV
ncbi:MAG: oligosaccharide flippase family protein, partial [Vicinamibacterales bacterium]